MAAYGNVILGTNDKIRDFNLNRSGPADCRSYIFKRLNYVSVQTFRYPMRAHHYYQTAFLIRPCIPQYFQLSHSMSLSVSFNHTPINAANQMICFSSRVLKESVYQSANLSSIVILALCPTCNAMLTPSGRWR